MDADKQYFDAAREIAGYQALSLKAMILYAWENRDNPEALDAASAAWDRNAVHFVHAGEWFGGIAREDKAYSTDDYLAFIKIAGLSKSKAEALCAEYIDTDLQFGEVLERVAELKHRNGNGRKAKVCPKCGAEL